MIRIVIALVMSCVAVGGCRGGAHETVSPEPPAPRIELELAPGSRLVDPRTMQAMPEGISYPGNIVFALPKRQLEVKVTKSNYQKIAQ